MIRRSPKGYRCGESHPRAKLTDQQVDEMRALRQKTGMSYAKLAAMFCCGASTARDIVCYWTRPI